jgi:tripartite-type tricarboxylate transporter receptor subunit TctC
VGQRVIEMIARLGLLIASAALVFAPSAFAQDVFPSRPIVIVVPFPPGGSADVVIRPIAQKMSERIGQAVIVDNRPGGAGNVGAMAVKLAARDGYTLFLGNTGTHAINAALFDNLRFDPIKDFQPVTLLVEAPSLLVVPTDSPATTPAELAALAKSKAGGLVYASQGIGSGGHLLAEMFKAKVGVPMVHVPYRGAAPAVQDLVGGRVDFLFAPYLSVGPQIEAGKLRVLGVSARKRAALLPAVPTMAEAGFAGVELDFWHGILAPAGLPASTLTLLHRGLSEAAQNPELSRLMISQGAEVVISTPEEFAARIAADVVGLGRVVRQAGAKVE